MKMGYTFRRSGNGNVGSTRCRCSSFLHHLNPVSAGLILLLGVGLSPVSSAENAPHQESTSQHSSSADRITDNQLNEQRRATLWGLDLSEWTKYKNIMQGPRGLWTPGLDPIQVLGINAKTDAERNHYASKMAKMEFERMKREGAFSDAYHRHYQQLLGDTLMYPKQKPAQKQTETTRYHYFVKLPCNACQSQIRHWIDQGIGVDIYFVEANNNAIKLFAQMTGISPLLVQSRQITLNHTNSSQLKALGLQQFPSIKKEWK